MECRLRSLCAFLCVCFASIFSVAGSLTLTPAGDFNAASNQNFVARICVTGGQQPSFRLEYVTSQTNTYLYMIKESDVGQRLTDDSCAGHVFIYTYGLEYIDHPNLVGQSVKLKVTTTQPYFSVVSSGVITFQALYSLTGSSTYALLGQDYTWTCDTSGEKPAGQTLMYICWSRGGYQSEQRIGCSGYIGGSCQTENNIPPYIFSCTSNVFTLTIPGANLDESQKKSWWRCIHGFRSIVSSPKYTSPFKELSVAIPPTSDPVIAGYDGSPLHEGSGTMRVTCRQEGGNPVANMTFVCQGNTGPVTTSGNVIMSSHTLTINRSLDKQTCTCITTHTAGNFQRTVVQSFIVYYPPQQPSLQLNSPYPWKSGENRYLTCITTGGNPTVYNFTWIEGTSIIHVGQQLNFSPLTTSDNGRQISCQVDNAFRGQPIRSTQTTLQVEYDPQVNVDTTAARVIEGRTFIRTCTATGNPTPTVRWYRGGGTGLTSPQTSTSTLTVTNINRTDTAQYTCQATAQSTGSNNLQPAQGSFGLTVLYPPDVNVIVSGTSVNTAEINLTCSANGVPNVYTFHGWEQHFGNQLIRSSDQLSTMTIEGGRILRLRNVTYDDMGDYKCTVNNSVPDRSGIYVRNDMALLDVKAAATFLRDDKKFQQRFDDNLTVLFDIYANPPVTSLIWKKDTQTVTGNDIVISKISKILMFPWHSKSAMVNGTRITMEIVPFKKTRIGNYSVIIKNGVYGEIEKEFEINVNESENDQTYSETSTMSIGLYFAGLLTGIVVTGISLFIIFLVRRRNEGLKRKAESAYETVRNSATNQNTYEGLRSGMQVGTKPDGEYIDMNISDNIKNAKDEYSTINPLEPACPIGIYANTSLSDK